MITSEAAEIGLYLHVPFCFSKCAYCGFYSQLPDESLIAAYLQEIEAEIESRLPQVSEKITTVFVGGGNPLCLGLSGLQRLVGVLMKHVCVERISEWTFEANPENLTLEIAHLLQDLPGIRISLGVQRLQDQELERLGRRARLADIHRACDLCAGHLPNFGIDLILGVPGCNSICSDLKKFLELYRFEHLSAYFLTVEPGTALQRQIEQRQFPDPETADPQELYNLREVMSGKGFEHYEISNYARPGRRCRHNLNYWKPGDYLGLGPSAVGTQGGLRRYNPGDLQSWLAKENPVFEQLSQVDRRNEYLMLRLRLLEDGLDLAEFERRFGCQTADFYQSLHRQIGWGNLEKKENLIKLSEKGIIFADNIIADLFM